MIHVFGHPRSGNHYLCHLVEVNAFGPMQQRGNQHHRWPPPFSGEPLGKLFEKKNERFLYVWRNYEDVLASLLAQSSRINGDISPKVFNNTPWIKLVEDGKVKQEQLNRWIEGDQQYMTPYECWKEAVEKWLSFAETRSDIYTVRYEDLMSEFHDTMDGIAQWLGLDRNTFKNIAEKVDAARPRKGGYGYGGV
ncbi:hypothetical protein LCGC14_0245140 [marine sediment metagenome]|uniref:Sulfotransferase domain-containing protein n=1 Tax=marine sediment metagenome TaxID=412755 RepID=A0A0F9UN31_9ZZZZ